MGIVSAIGAGLGLAGSIIGSSSANKNSKRAAQTSADNNAANIALARESRDMSLQRLDPYSNRGNVAGQAINDLLGIGGGVAPTAQPTMGQPNALGQYQTTVPAAARYGIGESAGGYVGTPTTTGGAASVSAVDAQQSAFDRFRNSTGYQFRLGEGLDAVNSGYAGAGVLQSGAAMRGITEYGQNFASNEFNNYINALGAQQAVGAGAASSAAGVSQNYASQVMNSNNLNAQNQMAAQLSRQNPFANALGTLGGFAYGFGGG